MHNGTDSVTVKSVRLYEDHGDAVSIGKPGIAYKKQLGSDKVKKVPRVFIRCDEWGKVNSVSDIVVPRWLAVELQEKGLEFNE